MTQLGAELIQEPSVQADGEMIAMVVEALKASGLEDFQVSIGEVEYFKGICSQAGLDEETENELRDFISSKNFFGAQELLEQKAVRRDYCEILLKVNDLFGSAEALQQARELVNNERSLQAVERLEELYQVLCEYGVEKYVSFDLGLLSKYRYYTGVIFKAYTYGVGDAVAKGGRYNSLLKYFGKDAPAIGFVIVVDDLLEALSRQKRKPQPAAEGILIIYEEGRFRDALEKAAALRADGVPTELIPASVASRTAQDSAFADRIRIYREKARAHMQKAFYYLPSEGGCAEEILD